MVSFSMTLVSGPLHRDLYRPVQNQSQMVLSHSLEKLRGQGSSDIYLDLRDHYHQHVYGHHHLIILIAIIIIIMIRNCTGQLCTFLPLPRLGQSSLAQVPHSLLKKIVCCDLKENWFNLE